MLIKNLKKICLENKLLLAILLVSVFFRFYNLESLFHFDWDQERDAQVIWQIVNEHKLTLIGPRAVGPEGFFLGPLWFYLLTPFYLIFGMDPIAGAVFASSIGVLTTLVIFLVTKNFFGQKEALIASFLWATYSDRSAWNPSLIPLMTLILLYLCIRISEGSRKFIPVSVLLFALSLQIHFQSVAFAIPLLISMILYVKKHPFPVKEIIIGLLLSFLTLLPLVIFDLRHDFLNSKSLISFFVGTSSQQYISSGLSNSFFRFFRAISSLFPEVNIPFLGTGLTLLAISILGIFLSSVKLPRKILLISTILFPLLLFAPYKGNLQEYYFGLTFAPMVIGLGLFLKKVISVNLWKKKSQYFFTAALCLGLLALFLTRANELINKHDALSLYYKKQAVSYIVNQGVDKSFNVAYSVLPGLDTGFKYLFKYYKKEPLDNPSAHLWVIAIPPNKDQTKPLIEFGGIGVVRR